MVQPMTVRRLSQLDDPGIRIVRQTNSGVSIARTRAMSEARGKYVAFLDADDVWRADHLLHLLNFTSLLPAAWLYGNDHIERVRRLDE